MTFVVLSPALRSRTKSKHCQRRTVC